MAVTITFLGGPETGNVAETVWPNPLGGADLVFPIRSPVTIDPDASGNASDRDFLAHVIKKARTNRFFRVDPPAASSGGAAMVIGGHDAPKRRGRPPKAVEVEADGEDAN